MNRIAMEYLVKWKNGKARKPLIIRGARQTGKTYLVREFGKKHFSYFVEINFEYEREACKLFNRNYDPDRVIKFISARYDIPVNKKTLIFFDEIQECPDALISMRYFYEKKPELFIIGAGSLLEFTVEEIGIPVGRIRSLYLYPMSFYEFLVARGKKGYIEMILDNSENAPIDEPIHNELIELMGEYLATGGMPEAVKAYIEGNGDFTLVKNVQEDIVSTFTQDFHKYAKKKGIKYVEKVFESIPVHVGEKFVFSKIDEYLKIREIKGALELLTKAGIVHKVFHTSANGIPLGAEMNYKRFKVIFMDVGLSQTLMGENRDKWFLNPRKSIVARGSIAENFTGMEMLAYSNPFNKKNLYYWVREKIIVEKDGEKYRKRKNAEVDYIDTINENIIPIEVKSGRNWRSNSIKIFIEEKIIPYGVVFSNENFRKDKNLKIIPLYAIMKLYM